MPDDTLKSLIANQIKLQSLVSSSLDIPVTFQSPNGNWNGEQIKIKKI